jgi:membrane fusion protein
LFREELIQQRRVSFHGVVQLASPLTHATWAGASVIVGGIVVTWLFLGHYTRREHVEGVLTPTTGMVSVNARSAGTVSRFLVSDGSHVNPGDPLVELSGEQSSTTLGDTSAAITRQLTAEQLRLHSDIRDLKALAVKQEADLRMQDRMLTQQIERIDAQEAIAQEQATSVSDLLARIEPLTSKGYVSALDVQQQRMQKLTAETQVKDLQRRHYESKQQLDSVRDQLEQLPLTTASKVSDLQHQLSQNDQALAQNELGRSAVVRAPEKGTVTGLIVARGQAIATGDRLMSIVPDGAPLRAELMVPSSAAGFVGVGTTVALHYQAFPYQKFGVQRGHVVDVSKGALTQHELTELLGGDPPKEPMYRVVVALEAQSVMAYGKEAALKPGMALDADMMLDKRRIIEWALEPIYGMQRRSEAEQ